VKKERTFLQVGLPAGDVRGWCDDAEAMTAAAVLVGGNEAPVAKVSVEYLQGDWPVPAIYAKGSGVPGLPAAPFIATATVRCA
jgi:hypothetical protein